MVDSSFTVDNFRSELSMYFVFRDEYGNDLSQLESGWSDY